jgi:Spx/MgsR family transcriptional regulator
MIQLYGIKNCDSVRKARKFFASHHIAYTFIDFRETPVTQQQIDRWLESVTVDALFNHRSTTYRNLKLKEKQLSDNEKRLWLAKENMLIKRPVAIFEKEVIIGYNESHYHLFLEKERDTAEGAQEGK